MSLPPPHPASKLTQPEPESTEPQPSPPETTTCEFQPCQTGPNKDPRKVISHIFGRNKTLTKLFPSNVWVYYCRQHYQRARYRAREWPTTQCELLLISLARMENWGGVAGFRVLLRRREDVRVFGGRSISASRVRKKKKKKKNQGRLNQKEKLRKKPTIPASPVPGWLRAETDERAVRSFDEIRAIVNRLKMGFEGQRDGVRSEEGGEEVMHRFPDIEILPVFKDA